MYKQFSCVMYSMHMSIILRMCVCGGRGWRFCEIIPRMFYIRGGGFPNGGLNCLEL